MRMTRIITLFLIFSFISATSFAQPKDYYKAEKALSKLEYYDAIAYYKKAFLKSKRPLQAEITFKIAECYRVLHKIKQQKLWYKKAIIVKYPDPLVYLYYAEALKMNGEYDEAIVQYKKYSKLAPDDPRGRKGVTSTELVQKWEDNPSNYEVENMAFFNSKDMDWSPIFADKKNNTVYFVSNRQSSKGTDINPYTGQAYNDLFWTKMDKKGKWSMPTPLTGDVNSKVDDGTATLNSKFNEMFFTRCFGKPDNEDEFICKVFTAKKKGQGWGNATELIIGDTDADVRYPSLSRDQLTLYFTAVLPGGFGGADIWMLKRAKKNAPFVGDPVNLGPEINTAGTESFPSIRSNGILYFSASSDYHTGMGGLDIFKAVKKSGKWTVQNMKYPINSPGDDFGIIFNGTKEKGYLCSTRKGGKGQDDIYMFYLPPLEFVIKGYIKNEETDQSIVGATIKIKGSDGSAIEIPSEADGSFEFQAKPETDYLVETSRKKFFKGKGRETTKGRPKSETINMDVYMKAIPDGGKVEIPNIFYDYAKASLRPESEVALNKLLETLSDNPSFVIELRSHTDFRGKNDMNMELSQRRAQSVVDYLISKNIDKNRLQAVGRGEEEPATINDSNAKKYPGFLRVGDVLTEDFIKALSTVEEQEVAHQINRRTDMKVVREDYVPKQKSDIPETPVEEEEE